MKERMQKWLEEGRFYQKVRVACGGEALVRTDAILGYCHCAEHRGFVTKNVFDGHDCLKKGCFYFEKFENCPCWERAEARKKQAERERALRKERKREEREREIFRAAVKARAQEWCDLLGYPIVISSVLERAAGEFTVFFVSDAFGNDAWLYMDLGYKLQCEFGGAFLMRRTRRPGGGYATAEDLRRNGLFPAVLSPQTALAQGAGESAGESADPQS